MIELNGKPFSKMMQSFGGDTLNAAVYLSRCSDDDTEVFYVTALGNDAISEQMQELWRQEGVRTELVVQDPKRTPGLYMIQVDNQGERSFLYWRDQSAARYLLKNKEFKRVKESLLNMDVIFVSGISLAILPENDQLKLISLLKDMSSQGIEIAFDSNYRPILWPEDNNETIKRIYKEQYAATSLALVTFDDEQAIWGDENPEATLKRLQSNGVKQAIVKLGEKGCLVQDFTTQEPASYVQTQPVDKVVDTTSAGDSFNGGFLASYATGEPLIDACKKGNQVAGVVIQHKGAIIPKGIIEQLAL